MTCKDCLHYEACLDRCRGFGQETELCEHFSDNSEWVHFPGKDYKTAYFAIGRDDEARVIAEPICGWGVKNGRPCIIDEYGYIYEIATEVFLTKENAEKEVERRKKPNELQIVYSL